MKQHIVISAVGGDRVGMVMGGEIFGLKGQKLYDLKGSRIYKLNGDLVGHLSDPRGAEKHLDKATDKLFSSTSTADPSTGAASLRRL